MDIIVHRRNTIDKLKNTPKHYGVEVDIRSQNNNLIIHHDPYCEGVPFDQWIKHFNHQTLILNVKEEGLEEKLISIMKENSIENYFFLDQSFPLLLKTAKAGESRCAVRVSEYESISTAYMVSSKVDWIWLDYFTTFPLTESDIVSLKEANFKICMVSLELHGSVETDVILDLKKLVSPFINHIDAVCTRYPELWN